uniref:zinc phosphodiesterase ELAC protein 1-like n=1 Tax=Styela clava TaxID=7725 RepID=UPI00193A88AD|nr:zinc phosphodiesterase ELAC protein 1-like [Styela clava]
MDVAFLGTGSGYPSPCRSASCMAIRHEGEVWLIDCGEGSQTQIMKTKLIRPGRITKIFITHLHGDHLFGLPGLLCTISMAYKSSNEEAMEVEKEDIDPTDTIVEIYGPCGLRRFLRESLNLSRSILSFKYVVHELVPENKQYNHIKGGDPDWSKWSPDHMATGSLHINECKHGRAIFYDSSCEGWFIFKDEKITILAGQLCHRIPAFGYVFFEPPKPGRLESEKLQKAGVPKGPLYGKIKRGESVTLADGTVINPRDYIGPEQPGRKVAILQDTRDSWSTLSICQNCDVMIHEATNENSHYKQCYDNGHSTPAMAAEFATAANASTLVLTHFSQRYKDPHLHEEIDDTDLTVDKLVEEAGEGFLGNVIAAYDGLILPVTRKVK